MRRLVSIALAVTAVAVVGGTGISRALDEECLRCHSAGIVHCPDCRTMVICPVCAVITPHGMVLANPQCPKCQGTGVVLRSTGSFINHFEVECYCRGKIEECQICEGKGYYSSYSFRVCDACLGKGDSPCPECGGDGKLKPGKRLLRR